MRLMQNRDHQPLRQIYQALGNLKSLPPGFTDEFTNWLAEPVGTKFVSEVNGLVVGCCGFMSFEFSDAFGTNSRTYSFAFGIIHPAFQRQGLGRTQLAVRLALAQQMKAQYVCLQATETSKPFLEISSI